jgi:dipeptidyl aminopeptidase/acylaminoacyl peptidase
VEGTEGLAERTVDGEPRFSQIAFLGWNDAGTTGLVSAVSYGYNFRWLWSVDAASGTLTLLDTQFDEAWIAGPCSNGCTGWIPDADRIYFATEESGYAHLHAIDPDGSGREALTSGEWEVLSVQIPEDRRHFLLRTNEGSPFSQHVWRMDFDGGNRVALTHGDGQFNVTPSPDGRRMAVVHSRSNRPGELFVAPLRPGAELEQVTVSPTAEWLTYPWIQPEIIRIPARDGAGVPARIYRPADFGVRPNGAAVLFVHGAGYLQNVHNWWSQYSREYMFHHFLASQGYTVLDVDYRGSAGYGRDWRTAIYRHMGGWDLSDHTDAARWLVANEGVEEGRIGIYGGSYGGFITLMALFTEPDVFTAGAALRAVTDWAHYNHNYTARILNQPQEDGEAYRRSSPIYFAEKFQPHQHLLIAHGMVDVNVHFSDVVRLAQRLIELGKENWEMAVYPVEDHGFVAPSSWTDEYRRIWELFERTIGGGG